MAARKKTPSLPSWATLIHPRFESDLKEPVPRNPVELVEEESYLRTKSYHALSRQMDLAAAHSLEQLSKSVEAQLSELVDKVEPEEDDPSPPTKRARMKEQDAEPLRSICGIIDPPERYNPLLLPILILQGPSYCLDRQEWMKHLILSAKRTQKRSAVVWLRPTTGLGISWQEEITRQCLNQEPDLPAALRKRRKMAKTSITEILLTWAGHTQAFDDILVYLEVENSFYARDLQDFICWLAERRAVHGLPFVLVLLGPHVGRRKIELRSAAQNSVGLIVRQCILPSTKELLNAFWERLWLKQGFPIPFPADVIATIADTFQEHHRSAVQVILDLKKVLAHHFLTRGSFLTATANERTLPDEQRRIAWFLMKTEARKLIVKSSASRRSLVQWRREMESRRRSACVAMEVLHLLHMQRDSSMPFLLRRHQSSASSSDKALNSEKRGELVALLARLRKLDDNYGIKSVQSQTQTDKEALVQLINELIILADSCSYPPDMEQCLEPVLKEWTDHVNAQGDRTMTSSALASLIIQPRRHTVAGLMEGRIDASSPVSVSSLIGRMYKLIQDRVSLSQDDWYSAFRADLPSDIGRQESFSLFICGINYLKLQGLLREKRVPSRGDIVYEKAVLVWCSGD